MRALASALLTLASLLPASEPATLFGKVMCGYQGWFATPTDGSGLGWVHYGFNQPGQCHIDLWPDVSELGADEPLAEWEKELLAGSETPAAEAPAAEAAAPEAAAPDTTA